MRILYIMPVYVSRGGHGSEEMTRRREVLQQWAVPKCRVSIVDLDRGPYSIESMAEEYLAVPGLLHCVQKAESEGFDAAIVGCYGDPGVDACREVVSMPILGPGECSMLVAATLGHRFSIVTVLGSLVRPLGRLAKIVGVDSKLASVRETGIPVLELAQDSELSYRRVLEVCRRCVSEDGADTLILGCMSMAFLGITERLQAELRAPVVNPAMISLKFAEMLVQTGLSTSKLAFPTPPKALPLEEC